MITEASIKALRALENKEISRQEILDCGFKQCDIKILIDQGIIKRVRWGIYQIISKKQEESIDEKFKRCLNLLENASIEEAKNLFLECISTNSKYMDELFKLVLEELINKNYEKVFLYFKLVLASNSNAHIREVKYYLYLLNYFTNIPIEYKELIKDLKCEDIIIPEDDDVYATMYNASNIPKLNPERQSIFNSCYYQPAWVELITSYESIEQILKSRRIYNLKGRNRKLNKLVAEKDYKAIIAHLDEENTKRVLPKNLEAIRIIANYLVGAIDGNLNIPITNEDASDYYEAIQKCNLRLALNLIKNRRSDDSLRSLLRDLLNLLEVKNNPSSLETSKPKVTLEELTANLTREDKRNVDEFYKCLPEYLRSIGKHKYEFLIINLTKICVLEEKQGRVTLFEEPFTALCQLTNNTFIFDFDSYEAKFYNALNAAELEAAQCYFYIIEGFKSTGSVPKGTIKQMRQSLDDANGVFEPQKNPSEKSKKGEAAFYYGIENVQEIMKQIEQNGSKIGIDRAGRQLGLDRDTISYIKLIYAKIYYSHYFYDEGDKLLQSVEKSGGKSKALEDAIREIRIHRNLYAHQTKYIDISKMKLLKP